MKSNRQLTTTSKGTSSSSLPPRVPKATVGLPKATSAAGDDDAAAEARRASRSRLLDSLHRKQEILALSRVRGVRSPSGSRLSQSSASTSTIRTCSKTQQEQQKEQEDSGSFKLLSPDKFEAYRRKIGHVPRLPVSTVNVKALKSPASTLGASCSSHGSSVLLSPVVDAAATTTEAEADAEVDAESLLEFFDKNNDNTAGNGNVIKKVASLKKKKKKKERTQPSNAIFREMRQAAAFDAQTYVFTHYQNMSKEQREAAIHEQFHGAIVPQHTDGRQVPGGIKGTLAQLVNGDSAYAVLYDEGDVIGSSKELILKKHLCGTESSS